VLPGVKYSEPPNLGRVAFTSKNIRGKFIGKAASLRAQGQNSKEETQKKKSYLQKRVRPKKKREQKLINYGDSDYRLELAAKAGGGTNLH